MSKHFLSIFTRLSTRHLISKLNFCAPLPFPVWHTQICSFSLPISVNGNFIHKIIVLNPWSDPWLLFSYTYIQSSWFYLQNMSRSWTFLTICLAALLVLKHITKVGHYFNTLMMYSTLLWLALFLLRSQL